MRAALPLRDPPHLDVIEVELGIAWDAHGLHATIHRHRPIPRWGGRRLWRWVLALAVADGLIGGRVLLPVWGGLALLGIGLFVVRRGIVAIRRCLVATEIPLAIRGHQLLWQGRIYDLGDAAVEIRPGGIDITGPGVSIAMGGHTDRAVAWLASRLRDPVAPSTPDDTDRGALEALLADVSR